MPKVSGNSAGGALSSAIGTSSKSKSKKSKGSSAGGAQVSTTPYKKGSSGKDEIGRNFRAWFEQGKGDAQAGNASVKKASKKS